MTADDPIATDRPTFANSSSVVPIGSLQFENGFSANQGHGVTTYDLPETRARIGISDCTELLVDVPDYTRADTREGINGASNIGPAVKHQLQGLIDGLTLSATLGVFLNTGDKDIAGRGPAPYGQLPWSYDLGDGWSVNGMFSETFHPRGPNDHGATQTSFYVDRTVGENADVFTEYVNDYQHGAATLNRVAVGGSYRYLPTRQIDFKVGTGVNGASSNWFFTLGYSFRFDRLFAAE